MGRRVSWTVSPRRWLSVLCLQVHVAGLQEPTGVSAPLCFQKLHSISILGACALGCVCVCVQCVGMALELRLYYT